MGGGFAAPEDIELLAELVELEVVDVLLPDPPIFEDMFWGGGVYVVEFWLLKST
jgi:hypothetical protein